MQVKYSQSLSAAPLLPWIVCNQSGNVLGAHCTCMAGLVGYISYAGVARSELI